VWTAILSDNQRRLASAAVRDSLPCIGSFGAVVQAAVVHGSENQLFGYLQNVRRAADPDGASIENVGIDHGGRHVLVA